MIDRFKSLDTCSPSKQGNKDVMIFIKTKMECYKVYFSEKKIINPVCHLTKKGIDATNDIGTIGPQMAVELVLQGQMGILRDIEMDHELKILGHSLAK